MPPIECSIPAVLEDRALRQPDDIAYTFIDYEVHPAGLAESLTWSQVHQRVQVVADEALDVRVAWRPGRDNGSAEPGVHRRFPRRDTGRLHRSPAVGAAVRSARRAGVGRAA